MYYIRCIWMRRSGCILAVQGGDSLSHIAMKAINVYIATSNWCSTSILEKKTCAEQLAKTWWSTQESLGQLKPTRNRAQGYIYFGAGKGAESAVVLSWLHCIRAILCVKAHYVWKRPPLRNIVCIPYTRVHTVPRRSMSTETANSCTGSRSQLFLT